MVKDLHRFRCPCCKESLEFDARSKKVRHLKVDIQDENKLNELMDAQREESERLGDAFSLAAKAQGQHKGALEDLFDQAFVASYRPFGARPGRRRVGQIGFTHRFGVD